MPKTTYRWVGRIVCIVLGIVVALFVAEILVRHFDPQITLSEAEDFSFPCFAQGASRWIKLASNKTCILRSINGDFPNTVVKTNSLGLRNPEITLTKPPSTKRILFIGDSYTMGWGVPEQSAYPRLTEKLLDTESLPFAVQDINAGFTASGPSGYYLYLKQHGLDLSPDIIVIGFYLGNDILARRDVEWVKTDADGLPLVLRSKSTYVDAKGEMRKTTLPL